MLNMNERRKSRVIYVGGVAIGGNHPIAVQSMTNTDSHDFEATYRQMKELEEAGCDIVRLTLPDIEACETVAKLKKSDLKIPLVGDIHFNYKVALAAADDLLLPSHEAVDRKRTHFPGSAPSLQGLQARRKRPRDRALRLLR